MTDPIPSAIPAATLVIFRDRAAGQPELLMVERARTMAFAGGAMVFPGGRVDPGDRSLAALHGDDGDDAAARIAAIRETIEEAGLPIGLTPMPDAATLVRLRARLHAGDGFGGALAEAGIALAIDKLVPFARWCPAHRQSRLFDTRFYLARLPGDSPQASVDETENVRLVWATARHVLDQADAGRLAILFPTRCNLERLAGYDSFDAAVADARLRPVRTITPWTEERGGVPYLCIPDDLGYPVTAAPLTGAVRG